MTRRTVTGSILGLALLLTACASSAPSSPGSSGSPPPPVETNPAGDIPDNTAFVVYRADGGFDIQVPEGWARKSTATSVTFSDKLNSVSASWQPVGSAPTVTSAQDSEVPQLQASERAFQLQSVGSVPLPGGRAVLIQFQEDGPTNEVTGKRYRLDVQRFEFFQGETEAVLTLSSPVGADNVDPWRIVSESFAWS